MSVSNINGLNYRAIAPNVVKQIAKDDATLIVSVAEAVAWNNQTPTVATFQQALYSDLIKTARDIVEKYCWLDLTQSTYEAYFELQNIGFMSLFGSQIKLLLPRAPILQLSNILKVEYLDDTTHQWTVFNPGAALGADGLYENETQRQEQRQWASIFFKNPPQFSVEVNAYKIRVTFTAGYDYPYTGAVSLSYNSVTGVVTCTTALPNFLNNNGMYVTISGAAHAGYNVTKPITMIDNTHFTYQLANGLTLPADTGTFLITPNGAFAMPPILKLAIKNIIAYNYATRGDVPSLENLEGYPVPAGTRAILDQYALNKTILGGTY